MKRCIAYTRATWSPHAWIPCMRRHAEGSDFCRRHEDAIHGTLLGLWVHGVPRNGGVNHETETPRSGPGMRRGGGFRAN